MRAQKLGFIEWLDARIKEKGLNGAKLAFKLEVYPSTVSSWLIGRSKPSAEQVSKLAAILEVEPKVILGYLGVTFEEHEYTPEVAAFIQELDTRLAQIEDPAKKALVIEQLASFLQWLTNLMEGLDELFGKKS